MTDKCPKCGAPKHKNQIEHGTIYECFRIVYDWGSNDTVECLRRQLDAVSRDRDNYRSILEGQGFQHMDRILGETRDCRVIGERARMRVEEIIAERDAALKRAEEAAARLAAVKDLVTAPDEPTLSRPGSTALA